MTIAYTWTISSLDVAPSDDGMIDVIKVAHWRYRATDSTDGISSEVYGAQGFATPDPASYTPFDSVTEAQVVGWIEDSIGEEGMASMDASLVVSIENIRNPPIVTLPVPWATPTPEPTPEPTPVTPTETESTDA
jgi:hypothetical protein